MWNAKEEKKNGCKEKQIVAHPFYLCSAEGVVTDVKAWPDVRFPLRILQFPFQNCVCISDWGGKIALYRFSQFVTSIPPAIHLQLKNARDMQGVMCWSAKTFNVLKFIPNPFLSNSYLNVTFSTFRLNIMKNYNAF